MIAAPLCFHLHEASFTRFWSFMFSCSLQDYTRRQSRSWMPSNNQNEINEKISSTNTVDRQTLNMFPPTKHENIIHCCGLNFQYNECLVVGRRKAKICLYSWPYFQYWFSDNLHIRGPLIPRWNQHNNIPMKDTIHQTNVKANQSNRAINKQFYRWNSILLKVLYWIQLAKLLNTSLKPFSCFLLFESQLLD